MGTVIKLAVSFIPPFLAASIGSIFTVASIPTWYQTLNKPFFNPPNFIFGPVWTVLYFLNGLAAFLLLRQSIPILGKRKAMGIYAAQLTLNTLWSFLFFGLKNPTLAFIEIIILWIAIGANILIFYRLHRVSGILLIPYLLWTTFALFLNLTIDILN